MNCILRVVVYKVRYIQCPEITKLNSVDYNRNNYLPAFLSKHVLQVFYLLHRPLRLRRCRQCSPPLRYRRRISVGIDRSCTEMHSCRTWFLRGIYVVLINLPVKRKLFTFVAACFVASVWTFPLAVADRCPRLARTIVTLERRGWTIFMQRTRYCMHKRMISLSNCFHACFTSRARCNVHCDAAKL